ILFTNERSLIQIQLKKTNTNYKNYKHILGEFVDQLPASVRFIDQVNADVLDSHMRYLESQVSRAAGPKDTLVREFGKERVPSGVVDRADQYSSRKSFDVEVFHGDQPLDPQDFRHSQHHLPCILSSARRSDVGSQAAKVAASTCLRERG